MPGKHAECQLYFSSTFGARIIACSILPASTLTFIFILLSNLHITATGKWWLWSLSKGRRAGDDEKELKKWNEGKSSFCLERIERWVSTGWGDCHFTFYTLSYSRLNDLIFLLSSFLWAIHQLLSLGVFCTKIYCHLPLLIWTEIWEVGVASALTENTLVFRSLFYCSNSPILFPSSLFSETTFVTARNLLQKSKLLSCTFGLAGNWQVSRDPPQQLSIHIFPFDLPVTKKIRYLVHLVLLWKLLSLNLAAIVSGHLLKHLNMQFYLLLAPVLSSITYLYSF